MNNPLLRRVAAPAVVVAVFFGAGAPVRAQAPGQPGPFTAPVPPARRAPAPRPAEVPPLPPQADRIPPATVQVMVHRAAPDRPAREVRQVITRTRDRVHVAADGGEWWFARNPVDPRRVSAFFVDHREKLLVAYSDTDLANLRGIRGWGDVLTLGCVPPPPGQRPSGPARVIGGLRFEHWPSPGGRDSWWSLDSLLPAECTTPDGLVRVRLTEVRPEASADVLRSPLERLPAYREIDVAEWLEHR